MVRKKRDYRAEYAASKRRATVAGYKSEREYKKVRKELKLPKRAAPIPRRVLTYNTDETLHARATHLGLRAEAREWSAKHSRRPHSRYNDNMTDSQVAKYYLAFVEPLDEDGPRASFIKRQRIRGYLVPDILDDDEWSVNPSTTPLRR